MKGVLALTLFLAIYFSNAHGKTLLVETESKESESSEALNNETDAPEEDDAPGDYKNLDFNNLSDGDVQRIVRRLKVKW